MPQRMQEQCFLVFREALNNALSHSQAKRIDVSLARHGTSAVRLAIEDNGIGFDPGDDFPHPSGLGLSMMAERASSIGGHAQIDSADAKGTRITLIIPVAETSTGIGATLHTAHNKNNEES
jgi:signal transduction histidine kinase